MAAVAVHHEVDGPPDAPVLVLAGSLGTTLSMWDRQVPVLRERLRVVRYTARGHAGSPVPPGPYAIADLASDAIALLDQLGIQRASFCGLSIGGMAGLWLAAHHPDRVDRLVLCCTSAHVPPPERWTERAAAVRTAGSTETIADAVVARWTTRAFAEREYATVFWLRRMLLAQPPDGYAECCEALARMDLRDIAPTVRTPTLVISGSADEAIPPDHQRWLAAAIPGARLALLPAAHIANVEQPDAFNALVLEHVHP